MPENAEISFIIPTLNEERNLSTTIDSIKATMGNHRYEIIICDNGSQDKTTSIARSFGAKVYPDPIATIGGLRNLGARMSTAPLLVFLDADVALDNSWWGELRKILVSWTVNSTFITGSPCSTPKDSGFYERNWFSKFKHSNSNYINSGHLIVTRCAFDSINGFDEALKTAEDYDLCQRAKKRAISIFSSDTLKAYHNGYPKKLIDFVSRESWHGKQDISSLSSFLHSKTALISFANLAIVIVAALLSLLLESWQPILSGILISFILAMLLSYLKFGKSVNKTILQTTLCCELYLFGRVGSIFTTRSRPKARSK
jgi:glycosyltransferase involved in cell wall biosynthesis